MTESHQGAITTLNVYAISKYILKIADRTKRRSKLKFKVANVNNLLLVIDRTIEKFSKNIKQLNNTINQIDPIDFIYYSTEQQ